MVSSGGCRGSFPLLPPAAKDLAPFPGRLQSINLQGQLLGPRKLKDYLRQRPSIVRKELGRWGTHYDAHAVITSSSCSFGRASPCCEHHYLSCDVYYCTVSIGKKLIFIGPTKRTNVVCMATECFKTVFD